MLEYLPLPLRRAVYEVTWWLGDLLGPRAWRKRWQAVAQFPRVILWWLTNTGALVGEVCSRENRLLLWRILGVLPVLLVCFSLIFFLALANSATRRANNWYAQQAQMALANKEFAKARLAYQGLMQYEPEKPEYRLGLAMALAGLNDNATAHVLVSRLAPEDAAGYAAAQNIVAEQLLRASPQTPQMAQQAEKHLLNALKSDPQNAQTHAMLALLYARADQWDLVGKHVAQADPQIGELSLIAVQHYVKQGDGARALEWTGRAVTYFGDKARKNPNDGDARLKWAQATVMMRNLPGALEILDAGWKQTKSPVYPRAIAQVVAWWLDHSQERIIRKLELLEYGLRCNPQEPMLLKLLIDPGTLDDATAVAPTTAPVAGAMSRALCGAVSACRRKDAARARSELELSLARGGAGAATIAANVAYTWASEPSGDPESALLLAELLHELRPDDTVSVRARGLVLARMGRWRDCITDLEPVTATMPDDLKVHETLALAYGKLGQGELAAKHAALARPTTAPATNPSTRPTTINAVR